MSHWSVSGSFFLGVFAAGASVACTSRLVERASSNRDLHVDRGTAEQPDADAAPTNGPDALDAGPPRPLSLACDDDDQCYVTVSGNDAQHFCGLLKNGTVRCWGRDTASPAGDSGDSGDGALGRGVPVSPVEGATPAPVPGLFGVTQLSVGPNLGTCARTSEGAVYCWGRNEFGQLGRSPAERRLTKATRIEGLPPVDEVQLGHAVACAIATSDRALYCWGRRTNDANEPIMDGLGIDADGPTFAPQRATNVPAPTRELAIATSVDDTATNQTVIALLAGDVQASIGERTIGTSTTPLAGPSYTLVHGVTRIWEFAYASDGLVWNWRGRSTAKAIYLPSLSPVADVKLGASSLGVLLSTGKLFRWGTTAAGALGFTSETVPTSDYPLEMDHVTGQVLSFAVSAGAATCASLVTGRVECWGSNAFGELGRGTVDTAPHPQAELIK